MKIYVPDIKTYKCYTMTNKDTIRAYIQAPYRPSGNQGVYIGYRDYYITSDYLYADGQQQFTNYSTLPTCLSMEDLTDDVYYRLDFDKILVIFIILCIFCFYIPLKIFSKLFKRGGF